MADAGDKEKPAQPKKKTKAKGDAAPEGTAKKAKAADGKAAKAVEAEEEPEKPVVSLKGLLARELQPMMYGFGDDVAPLPETVNLVEEIVIEYISNLLYKAMDFAVARGKSVKGKVCPVGAEDIMLLVRKEPKKYARVRELLIKDEEIKNARKMFHDDEELAPQPPK